MKNIQLAIGVLFVVALLAFLYTHWRESYIARQGHKRPAAQRHGNDQGKQQTAATLLIKVGNLRDQNAQWAEIIKTLNPQADPTAHEILITIRGPHMFDPRTALGVLETGFKSVPSATLLIPALVAAQKSMDSVVTFGK